MSSSTSEVTRPSGRAALRWPLGPWMLSLLVLTTIGAAGLLGSMADPMISVGTWGYAVWPAAAIVGLLAVASTARFARSGPSRAAAEAQPLAEPFVPQDPPVVQRFRRRMGGWGTFVAGLSQLLGMVTAGSVIAILVAGTLLPRDSPWVRLGAVVYLLVLVVARGYLPEPHRLLTVVVVVAAVLGLLGVALHVQEVEGALAARVVRPRSPATVESVLEATALLPIAFLPLMRMSLMLPGLPSPRRRLVARRVLPLTALAATALGVFLGQAMAGVLEPVSATGSALTAADSDGHLAVALAARAVTLVLGTVIVLVLLDDSQVIGSRMMRHNALPDLFTAPAGRRVNPRGELLVLAAAGLAIVVSPSPRDLIAFSAFCVLGLFGSLHVAVMRPRGDGRYRIGLLPIAGLVVCLALVFSLPPEVILTGVALLSLAVSLRAVFIVRSEPLVPDIVEGVGAGPSAAASGGPEDAAGDLPADHRARGPEHGPEG